jgi:hypothetical protein
VLQGTREVTEGTLTHGVKDVPRCELIGKDDKTRMRADRSDLVNDLKILTALVLRPCNDQVEGVGRGSQKGSTIVGDTLNAPVFASENAVEQLIDLRAGINQKRDSLGSRGSSRRCIAALYHGYPKKSPPSPKV